MLGWIKNIGLSWKVQLAPAFLVLVLIAVGVYALLALRSNQAAVDEKAFCDVWRVVLRTPPGGNLARSRSFQGALVESTLTRTP